MAEWKVVALAALSGAFLALAAPGFEQWYIVWFVFSTFLIFTFSAKEPWQAS